MHHICAFNSSLAASTFAQVVAVTDQVLLVQNGNFIPQEDHGVLFAAAMSADLQRARISTAKLRTITTPWIRPIRSAAIPAAEPRVADYRANPLVLKGYEEIEIDAFQSNAGAQEVTALLGLAWGPQSAAPVGDIMTMRGTATTAAVADTWTTLAVSWQDNLPQGRYAVVGLEVQSANARAARMIIENQYPRPGSVSVTAIGDRQHEMFRKGGLGLWGVFTNIRMPIIEVFCNAADAAHEIYLDIIRVGF